MNLKRSLLTAVLALGIPLTASAADTNKAKPSVFDYNYADIEFIDYDAGDGGLRLSGSYDIKPNFNLIGGLSFVSDYTQLDIGVGHHSQWYGLENTDLNLFAGLEYGDFDTGFFSDSDGGIFFGAGMRTLIVPKLELAGSLSYHTFFDGDFVLSLEGLYRFTPKLHGKLGLDLGDNDTFRLGVRYDL
jgi:opacity protein-like surface antigen